MNDIDAVAGAAGQGAASAAGTGGAGTLPVPATAAPPAAASGTPGRLLTATDRAALHAGFGRLARGDGLLVVLLCAAWCGACREFRPTFERIAAAQPGATCLWLDVEDDSALTDAIDVENFPTLAIYGQAGVLHHGVSVPHEAVVARLVQSLLGSRRTVPAEAGVVDLPAALRAYVGIA